MGVPNFLEEELFSYFIGPPFSKVLYLLKYISSEQYLEGLPTAREHGSPQSKEMERETWTQQSGQLVYQSSWVWNWPTIPNPGP